MPNGTQLERQAQATEQDPRLHPDRLRKILKDARELLSAGVPRDEVFDLIADATDGRVGSTIGLVRMISAPSAATPHVSKVEALGEVAGQTASFGFSDEMAGAVEAIKEEPTTALRALMGVLGGTPASVAQAASQDPEAAQRFVGAAERGTAAARRRLDASEERLSGLEKAGATVAGIAPTLGLAAPRAINFIRGGGGLVGRAANTLLVGGSAGAAEGGLVGFGEAEGPIPERLEAARGGAVTGGLLGLGTAGVVGAGIGVSRALGRGLQSLLPSLAGKTRRGVEEITRRTGLTADVAEEGLEGLRRRAREAGIEDFEPVIADLSDDARDLARRFVSVAPETRAPGEVARRIIDRADSPAIAEAKRVAQAEVDRLSSLEGVAPEVLEEASKVLKAVREIEQVARRTAKMVEKGRGGLPEIGREGGVLGAKGEAVDALRTISKVNREYAHQVAEMLLGPDGVELLQAFTPSFGRRVARAATAAGFDVMPLLVGGSIGMGQGRAAAEGSREEIPDLFQP